MLTVETLSQLRGLLSERGILALNFVSFFQSGRNPALASVAKTVGQVFPDWLAFVSEPGEEFNDFIFVAANRPLDLAPKTLSNEQVAWLQERKIAVDPSQGMILTDNLNPLEHLQTAKAEKYRQILVDWFGAELLVR